MTNQSEINLEEMQNDEQENPLRFALPVILVFLIFTVAYFAFKRQQTETVSTPAPATPDVVELTSVASFDSAYFAQVTSLAQENDLVILGIQRSDGTIVIQLPALSPLERVTAVSKITQALADARVYVNAAIPSQIQIDFKDNSITTYRIRYLYDDALRFLGGELTLNQFSETWVVE